MKKILALLLSMAVVFSLTVAGAADAEKFLYGNYAVTEDSLLIFGRTMTEDTSVQVTVQGTAVADVLVSTAELEQIPVSYVCMVDTSSSLSNAEKQQQRDVLLALSQKMRPIDSMTLAWLGRDVQFSESLETAGEREEAINGTWNYVYDCDLYAGICTALQAVAPEGYRNTIFCPVLISDGIHNYNTGVSEQDALQAVRESGQVLHTVGLVQTNPKAYQQTNMDRLRNFADAGSGLSFVPSVDNVSADDLASQIVQAAQYSAVIGLNPPAELRTGQELELTITTVQDGQEYTDSLAVPVEYLPEAVEPATEPETQPETVSQTQPVQITEPEEEPLLDTLLDKLPMEKFAAGNGRNFLPLLFFGVLALVGLIVGIIVMRRRFSGPPAPEADGIVFMDEEEGHESYTGFGEPAGADAEPLDIGEISFDMEFLQHHEQPAEDGDFTESMAAPQVSGQSDAGCTVELVRVLDASPALKLELTAGQGRTVGRRNRSDFVLNENDPSLSGIHCEFRWNGSELQVKDRYSTNGTWRNAVRLNVDEWTAVEDGDRLHLGSQDYIVKIDR